VAITSDHAQSARPRDGSASEARADELNDCFAIAAGLNPVFEHHYRIAGRAVRMRFCGATVYERLSLACAHLVSESTDDPELTINFWDSAGSDRATPGLPVIEEAPDELGALYHLDTGSIQAGYQPIGRVLSALDEGRRTAWCWVADAAAVPYYVASAPIRYILHWWLGARGIHQVHAGAVGIAAGGVLFVGPSGSGKSTSSLANLGSSLLYAGDDYVAVSLDPEPYVHSLFCSGKIEPRHSQRFPHLLSSIWNSDKLDTEKAAIFVHQSHPEQTTLGFPIRAVLIPRVTGRPETRIVKGSKVAALAALAPSTIIQLQVPIEGAFPVMRTLMERVPCFLFELGGDLADIPKVLTPFIERMNAEASD